MERKKNTTKELAKLKKTLLNAEKEAGSFIAKKSRIESTNKKIEPENLEPVILDESAEPEVPVTKPDFYQDVLPNNEVKAVSQEPTEIETKVKKESDEEESRKEMVALYKEVLLAYEENKKSKERTNEKLSKLNEEIDKLEKQITNDTTKESVLETENTDTGATEEVAEKEVVENIEEKDKDFLKEDNKEIEAIKEKTSENSIAKESLFKRFKNAILGQKNNKKEDFKNEHSEIEKDRENKPFIYYAFSKINKDKNKAVFSRFITTFGNDVYPDLRICELGEFDHKKHFYDSVFKWKFLVVTNKDPMEGFFFASISGFSMVIKNVKEVTRDDGINETSEKIIYKIVGPDGEIVQDDIQGYDKAREIFEEKRALNKIDIEKEFNNLKN